MIAQHLVNSLIFGGIYAMIVIGYALVFSLLGLINLAHGAVMTVGAVTAYIVTIEMGLGLVGGLIAAAIISGLLGFVVERVAIKPVREQRLPRFYALITTFGFGMAISELLSNFSLAHWGQELRPFPPPFSINNFSLGGVQFNNIQLGILIVVFLVMIILNLLVKKTWTGRALRATSQNAEVAEMMGINTGKVISGTFILAGISAAVAGNMLAVYYSYISADIGLMAGLKGFIASLLGGRGLITGAILGGFVLGGVESIVSGLIGTGYRDLAAFGLLILILLVKPVGLLGTQEQDRA